MIPGWINKRNVVWLVCGLPLLKVSKCQVRVSFTCQLLRIPGRWGFPGYPCQGICDTRRTLCSLSCPLIGQYSNSRPLIGPDWRYACGWREKSILGFPDMGVSRVLKKTFVSVGIHCYLHMLCMIWVWPLHVLYVNLMMLPFHRQCYNYLRVLTFKFPVSPRRLQDLVCSSNITNNRD